MKNYRKTINRRPLSRAVLLIAFCACLFPLAARARILDKNTARRGLYNIKLKIRPAGPGPDRHVVVVVREDGRPVKHADVGILYRRLWPDAQRAWQILPMEKLRAAGFGNTARLASGHYDMQVSVNGSSPAIFFFTLRG